jgi:hypothetical protein
MKKISFDFDDTLEHEDCQLVAKDLIERGFNVCMLTSRYENPSRYSFPVSHSELFRIAAELGIKEIIFTNFTWKYLSIDKYDIDFHVDDNYHDEVQPINNSCKARAITCMGDWKNRLYNMLEIKE